ncbi:hypothetical protein [Lacticaseibacillus daqingensis]|uniref:hypothetical protein n=1 Tax=Lacticaseibacillus daqingensis TaxID=2486014 RepID=UPI000F76B34C|nr:hypothetical protein [Lacticaseibacillus daqingensis]
MTDMIKAEIGMAGNETIKMLNGNFNGLSDAVTAATQRTEPKTFTIVTGTANDRPPVYWRVGGRVYINGGISGELGAQGAKLFDIPVGFRPKRTQLIGIVRQENPMSVLLVQFNTDGRALVVWSPSKGVTWFDGLSWETDDDFPTA